MFFESRTHFQFFTIKDGEEWTIIFNKIWDQWGAFRYSSEQDVLRVKVKEEKNSPASDRLTFSVNDDGKINFRWDTIKVEFKVEE